MAAFTRAPSSEWRKGGERGGEGAEGRRGEEREEREGEGGEGGERGGGRRGNGGKRGEGSEKRIRKEDNNIFMGGEFFPLVAGVSPGEEAR